MLLSSAPRRVAGALLIAGLVTSLAACGDDGGGSADGSVETRTFAADNGEIEIPVDPERVVATGYAVPVLIEAGADLVGISEWSRGTAMMSEEDLKTYEELPKIAGDVAAETNYEAIAEADPDLIIVGVPAPVLGDIDMDKLESIAPVVALGPTVPDAWKELGEKQADAAGATEGYDEAKAAYEERAAELEEKYADALAGLDFGHVGSYGEVSSGTFMREFAGSWGTNVATDIGVNYYGEVKEKKGGSQDVSEYPSIEEIPASLGDADVITYSLAVDGSTPEAVQYVLDNKLFKNLPAAKQGHVYGLQYTEAATYTSALMTLDAVDEALEPLL